MNTDTCYNIPITSDKPRILVIDFPENTQKIKKRLNGEFSVMQCHNLLDGIENVSDETGIVSGVVVGEKLPLYKGHEMIPFLKQHSIPYLVTFQDEVDIDLLEDPHVVPFKTISQSKVKEAFGL